MFNSCMKKKNQANRMAGMVPGGVDQWGSQAQGMMSGNMPSMPGNMPSMPGNMPGMDQMQAAQDAYGQAQEGFGGMQEAYNTAQDAYGQAQEDYGDAYDAAQDGYDAFKKHNKKKDKSKKQNQQQQQYHQQQQQQQYQDQYPQEGPISEVYDDGYGGFVNADGYAVDQDGYALEDDPQPVAAPFAQHQQQQQQQHPGGQFVPPQQGDGGDALSQYLRAAFLALDKEYASIDADMCGMVTLKQLCRRISTHGFYDTDRLKQLFERVDKDRSSTLDFSEYLALMYLWIEVDSYHRLLKDATEATVVEQAFGVMEDVYGHYDADRSRTLSYDELVAFMSDQLPNLFDEPRVQTLTQHAFVHRDDILTFTQFLLYLYHCLVPDGTVKVTSLVDENIPLVDVLSKGFTALERDFVRFDADNSGFIDFSELTKAVSHAHDPSELVDVMATMEHCFMQVDLDKSDTLDFHEFMHFAYLVTEDSAWLDVVGSVATDPSAVKGALTRLWLSYTKYDTDESGRIEWYELCQFLQDELKHIPKAAEEAFSVLQDGPESKPHLDFVRFMQTLYYIICPNGRFATLTATSPPPKAKPQNNITEFETRRKPISKRPPRFGVVNPHEIVKGKKLGQGGQGVVYMARYKGHDVAAKFLLADATEEAADEAKHEAAVMEMFDHDNIHFCLGSHTQLPNIVILTEVCTNGSLFDVYEKERKKFDMPTQWRLAKECALGFDLMHQCQPPLMHRDIKSLNVLLNDNYTAKVADFGMACAVDGGPYDQGLGTPQWMAPEVLSSTDYDERCDVFSFGIMLWEITHMQIPYADTGMDQAAIAISVLTKDLRPPISRSCPKPMADLMRRCWQTVPDKRPTMAQVCQSLDHLKSLYDAQSGMMRSQAYTRPVEPPGNVRSARTVQTVTSPKTNVKWPGTGPQGPPTKPQHTRAGAMSANAAAEAAERAALGYGTQLAHSGLGYDNILSRPPVATMSMHPPPVSAANMASAAGLYSGAQTAQQPYGTGYGATGAVGTGYGYGAGAAVGTGYGGGAPPAYQSNYASAAPITSMYGQPGAGAAASFVASLSGRQ